MLLALFHWLFNFFSPTSTLAWHLAAPTAAVVVAATFYLLRGKVRNAKHWKWPLYTGLAGGLSSFYFLKLWIYFVQPVYNGYLGGRAWMIFWCLLIASITVAASITTAYTRDAEVSKSLDFDEDGRPVGVALAALAALLIVFLGFFGYTMVTAWSVDHKEKLAEMANINTASETETMPPTDTKHIVMVSQKIAAFRGKQAIGSDGTNLGSVWKTDVSDYTLQSVKGHLYWIAPLQIQNGLKKNWSGAGDSPGFIVVDAEDPNGEASVRSGMHIKLMPGSSWERQLERRLYMDGYTDVHLDDPTLEVNEDWKPFYTITAWKYAWGSQGRSIAKVLLVDAQTGEVTEYATDRGEKVPDWVDRIMSEDLVKNYASDWGAWESPESRWVNNSHGYQQKPDGMQLVYNNQDKPVWIVPMSSNNGSDTSANGVLVYSTQDAKGTFYNGPAFRGMGVGDVVNQTFLKIPANQNGNGKLSIESVQLYQVEGRPTWVAIYGTELGDGTAQFAGVGFVDAHSLDAANVSFANNREDALQSYKRWVAGGGGNGGAVANGAVESTAVTGTVWRIGSNPVGDNVIYSLIISNNDHVFTVTPREYASISLVREGDAVTFKYLDSGETTGTIREFSDDTLNATLHR